MSDATTRMHRKVSGLAYGLLAEGKLAAYEYACGHQDPYWLDPSLTPEAALERSLIGFVQPVRERRVSDEDRRDAMRMAEVCSRPAPWDIAGQKAEEMSA